MPIASVGSQDVTLFSLYRPVGLGRVYASAWPAGAKARGARAVDLLIAAEACRAAGLPARDRDAGAQFVEPVLDHDNAGAFRDHILWRNDEQEPAIRGHVVASAGPVGTLGHDTGPADDEGRSGLDRDREDRGLIRSETVREEQLAAIGGPPWFDASLDRNLPAPLGAVILTACWEAGKLGP